MHKLLYGALLLAVLHKASSSAIFGQFPVGRNDIDLGEVTNFTCPGFGVFPADDCDKYYTCYENSPIRLYLCRSNFLFDLTYNGCNYPEQVDCGNRTRPTGTNPPTQTTTVGTTPGPFKCPSDGFFPFTPNACSGNYYVCIDGVAYPQTCPGNSIFDPDRGVCATPETVPCYGISTTPGSTSGPFVCPTPDGNFPDPDDCSHFFTCTNGIPVITPCPGNLVFNPELGVCDFPQNVPSCQLKTKRQELIKTKPEFYGRIHN